MKLLIGLGNPGSKYELTRHNAGFWVVDALAEQLGVSVKDAKVKAMVGEARVGGERLVLAKPMTYMNLSGESVQGLTAMYRTPLSAVLVVYDDLDLPTGALRLRASGSPGTHNGMRSIVASMGTQQIPRLRMGIGLPGPHEDVAKYVLTPLPRDEVKLMAEAVARASDAVRLWVSLGIEAAMNQYNRS